jgi:hypothetical protein
MKSHLSRITFHRTVATDLKLYLGAAEKWADNKDAKLILILKGHTELQMYNLMEKYSYIIKSINIYFLKVPNHILSYFYI